MELLQSLFNERGAFPIAWAQLDSRADKTRLSTGGVGTHFINRNLVARLYSEWRLWRECRSDDVVLCFHGLPPLFFLSGQVAVFVQNRLLLDGDCLGAFPLSVRLRIRIERLWLRKRHCCYIRYFVQTPSMAAALRQVLGDEIQVSTVPFCSVSTLQTVTKNDTAKKFDFVYVASGDAHKNHRSLLAAWCELAKAGHRPSLALTVDQKVYAELSAHISQCVAQHNLAIENLGSLPRSKIDELYRSSGALIFPSISESFGLPLVEAEKFQLPILAPELDYVRDVVMPKETFDPRSPMSIARAVRRYLGFPQEGLGITTAEQFLAEVLG